MTHSERVSSVDTTWLRMDRPTNLMMIVAVWLLEACESKYLKFFLGTRRILKEALEAPDRFAYSDLAIAPPREDQFEALALYHATTGGEAALARKKLGDTIRATAAAPTASAPLAAAAE